MKNKEMTQRYSSWGDKLLRHCDVLNVIQKDKIWHPINVQLSLTEACDSNCPFCSVANRPVSSHMPWKTLIRTLAGFAQLGAKSVELTGGGNPMLYRDGEKNINDVIAACWHYGFKIGIITNSHNLTKIEPEFFRKVDWLRISLSKLDEGYKPADYDLGEFPRERVGFSYIIHEGTTEESLTMIKDLVVMYPETKFVRLAGDCLIQGDNVRIFEKWSKFIDSLDYDKMFFKDIQDQDIPFNDGCYVGMIRPYVAPHPEGRDRPYQVYVCTSHVLNTQKYDMEYSLGSFYEIVEIWRGASDRLANVDTPYEIGCSSKGWSEQCKHCFYQNNNKILHTVVTKMEDEDFA